MRNDPGTCVIATSLHCAFPTANRALLPCQNPGPPRRILGERTGEAESIITRHQDDEYDLDVVLMNPKLLGPYGRFPPERARVTK